MRKKRRILAGRSSVYAPIDVSLLGANAVMLASNDIADLVEQFRFVSIRGDGYYCRHARDSVMSVPKLKPD